MLQFSLLIYLTHHLNLVGLFDVVQPELCSTLDTCLFSADDRMSKLQGKWSMPKPVYNSKRRPFICPTFCPFWQTTYEFCSLFLRTLNLVFHQGIRAVVISNMFVLPTSPDFSLFFSLFFLLALFHGKNDILARYFQTFYKYQ